MFQRKDDDGILLLIYVFQTPEADSHRVINSALSYTLLAEHSTTFLPLSCSSSLFRKPGPPVEVPYLSYKVITPYQKIGSRKTRPEKVRPGQIRPEQFVS